MRAVRISKSRSTSLSERWKLGFSSRNSFRVINSVRGRLKARLLTMRSAISSGWSEIADRIVNSRAFNRPRTLFMTLKEFRELNPNFHRSDKDVERDFDILTARIKKLNERQGRPRIGDFVIYPDNSERRFTYDWSDVGGGLQTTCPTIKDASFYFTRSGHCDFSGALDDPLPLNESRGNG